MHSVAFGDSLLVCVIYKWSLVVSLLSQSLCYCLYLRVILIPDFFFFQAEDGIRVVAVTGVQSCSPSRRRHTRCSRDWSSDVCSSDLAGKHLKQLETDTNIANDEALHPIELMAKSYRL